MYAPNFNASLWVLPMMGRARTTWFRVTRLATRSKVSQYSLLDTKSSAITYSTAEGSTPRAVHPSMKYLAAIRIFSMSPPNLLFSQACQVASNTLYLTPALTKSIIFNADSRPVPRCIRPLGSKPLYATGLSLDANNSRSSWGVTISSHGLRAMSSTRVSTSICEHIVEYTEDIKNDWFNPCSLG